MSAAKISLAGRARRVDYKICGRKLTEDPEEIPEPSATSKGGDLYFEILHLHPIQLDLSFMRTERVNVEQKCVVLSSADFPSVRLTPVPDSAIRLTSHNPLYFFINALTMALGNVNDAPVRLNALVIENARLPLPVLQERLTVHYGDEFFGQLYRVLGSADFIGWVDPHPLAKLNSLAQASIPFCAGTRRGCSPTFPPASPTFSSSRTTAS